MEQNYTILAMDGAIAIINPENETSFSPLILKSGIMYDGFTLRPVNPKPNQKSLSGSEKTIAKKLLDKALQNWRERQLEGLPEIPEPIERKPEQGVIPASPQSTLDSLIAESVAKISVGSVTELAKPLIDKYIKETYGIIPKTIEVKSEFGKHVVQGLTAPEFKTVLPLVTAGIPVFLSGPAGCGKNIICKQVADALGLQFYFSNAVTQEYKITGFIDANGKYQETQFYQAFKDGGLFMLDEMDASTPEVLVLLNASIANGYFDFPVGRVTAHKDFRVVAAGNTYGTGADAEYTGRYQLDASSLDRFCIVDVTYETEIEKALAEDDSELLDFIWDFRDAVKKAAIHFTVSYRSIERLCKISKLFDTKKAIKLAVLRGMEMDDAKLICNNMSACNNKYITAFRNLVD